eukprot:11177335-Lingulodinium_polyedra.AAC.1
MLAWQGCTLAWLGLLPAWWVVHAGDSRASEHEGKETAVEPNGGVLDCRTLGAREAVGGEDANGVVEGVAQ